MKFEEWVAKPLLQEAGIAVPRGRVAATPEEAAAIARELGPVVVKAQVATGKRGKAGGIRLAATPEEAGAAARAILGMRIGDYVVERLLVEEQVPIAREHYAAILADASTRGPLLLFSAEGGMDIEEIAARHPEALRRVPLDVRRELSVAEAREIAAAPGADAEGLADVLMRLWRVFRERDAELVEVNPLVTTDDGRVMALDCKFVLDDAAAFRHPDLAAKAAAEPMTELERRAAALGLKYIELDGDVGVLANGAGLTMTTMDAIVHFGGRPANFLEIGGDAYTKGRDALGLVLANPRVKSLLVNFCGAFARTDVMTAGIVEAWLELRPALPVAFSVRGTGEEEAVRLLREKLGIEPFAEMDDAVRAAVEAAR